MSDDMPEKMDLDSMDIAAEKRARLREVFPEVFAEDKIDFDQLRRVLGDWVDPGKERFGLTWPGKAECMRIVQEPSRATLKPMRDESVNFDETENVFIEGDNLEVLKLLQKAYFGKIKMIYIDPPYNTGGEFIYPDKFAETLETYLGYTGQTDEDGSKFSTNTDSSGRFHSRWLSMMYPRLYLARNLLREDGIIFISIDDNEVTSLRDLCDFIFGEENFISNFIWKSRQNKDNRPEKGVSIDHEYILCYGRRVRGDARRTEQYTNPDNDPRGPWASGNMVGLATKNRRPNLHFNLVNPSTGIDYGCPDMGWRYDPKTMERLIAEDRIIWPTSSGGRPRKKTFLEELDSEFTGTSSITGTDQYTRTGSAEISELFGYRAMDFPKPSGLIREFILQGSGKDDIILDFFSGSGTTAHATMKANVEDAGKRKFIMVQLPEPSDPESEAHRNGLYTIADIGRERIRRSGTKYNVKDETGLDLGDQPVIDTGFKSFRLDQSSFRTWDSKVSDENLAKQIEMHVEHVDKASTQEDLLYEILLKAGFELTVPVERRQMPGGRHVHVVAGGALVVCLEPEVDSTLIDAIAEDDPLQVICLDSAFKGNDQLKANAVQTFKARAQSTETEIVFKTV